MHDAEPAHELRKMIAAEVKADHCACEVKNPKGACCLGDLVRLDTRWCFPQKAETGSGWRATIIHDHLAVLSTESRGHDHEIREPAADLTLLSTLRV